MYMIEGVSRSLYDGYSHNVELNNFLVKCGMKESNDSSAVKTDLSSVAEVKWERLE